MNRWKRSVVVVDDIVKQLQPFEASSTNKISALRSDASPRTRAVIPESVVFSGKKRSCGSTPTAWSIAALIAFLAAPCAHASRVALSNDTTDPGCAAIYDTYSAAGYSGPECQIQSGNAGTAASVGLIDGLNLVSNKTGLFVTGGLEVFGTGVIAGLPAAYVHGGLSLFSNGTTSGTANKLIGLTPAAVTANSTDAVNGAQLYAANRYFKTDGLNDGTDDAVANAAGDVAIGRNAQALYNNTVAIGDGARADYNDNMAVGAGASGRGGVSMAVGTRASTVSTSGANYQIALGGTPDGSTDPIFAAHSDRDTEAAEASGTHPRRQVRMPRRALTGQRHWARVQRPPRPTRWRWGRALSPIATTQSRSALREVNGKSPM
ncbi:hypothetical protein [Paraburkholderia aromaticivorans]|uniref:hypothetical protein n=1 Tax=Paraburkholderia aromaticivorans TaxID=2026199 RepID=UPI0023F9DA6C|nr:hypothetical protein [Paraburkholderia aromaticivorans]